MPATLRSYLEDLGDRLIEIDEEVDPVRQVGILSSESRHPYLLNNLKGFPGWRLCDCLLINRELQALALGTSPDKVPQHLCERMFKHGPGKSVMVSDGPCKEVKLIGVAADVTKLPIAIHSVGDAGRYIGSGITITKDPETGLRNEAMIRALVKEPRRVPFWMAARHNWAHYLKYQERGEPMPMAYAIGLHPAYEILVNYSGQHDGWDELELGAGVLGETIEMVPCETIDLEVPALAEIIIEGIVRPNVREQEGPFGEFTCYRQGAEGPAPVWEITAITHRKNPIFRHIQSTHFTDHQVLVSLPMEATLMNRLRDVQGKTDIHEVYIPTWVTMFTVIIQMTARWDGQARDVLLAALSSPNLHPKIVIAVDQDVNIHDPKEIFWAISTRVNPERDVIIIPHERIHPLDISVPRVDNHGEVTVMRVGGKMAIDATKPPLWRMKEREAFERVEHSGAGDHTLDEILALLRQETAESKKFQPA
jgi:2,5-furandicarboxylate decarboxylase 1